MYDQQHNKKNTKQSSHSPSFLVDNVASSSNNQFKGTSQAEGWGKEDNPPIFATSERFRQFKSV
jgi:hypothetical protein